MSSDVFVTYLPGRSVRDRHLSRTPQFGQTSGLKGTSPPCTKEFWIGASQLGQRYKRFHVKVIWTIAAATSTKAMKQIQKREVGSGRTPSQWKSNTRKPASMTKIEKRTCRHVLARRIWNSATVSIARTPSPCCLTSAATGAREPLYNLARCWPRVRVGCVVKRQPGPLDEWPGEAQVMRRNFLGKGSLRRTRQQPEFAGVSPLRDPQAPDRSFGVPRTLRSLHS